MPVATQTASGSYDIWTVNEATGNAKLSLLDVSFLPIRAAGLRQVDSLRLDRPANEGAGTVAPYIHLPKRGALYRVRRGTSTAILHITAAGQPTILLELPDVGGAPALMGCLGVSWRGDMALVSTSLAAGGDIYTLSLTSVGSTTLLTSNAGPLDIEETSLRVSRKAAWFVAVGTLYCATNPSGGQVTMKPSAAPGVAHPELVLSADGESVAVFYEQSPFDRQLVVVPRVGVEAIVTPVSADYALPAYDNPLGPWVALSGDGGLVAYMYRESPWHGKWTHEIYVASVASVAGVAPTLKVTELPNFPTYIDNVGVLGFIRGSVLTFYAGDEIVSGILAKDGVGAADWYAANFNEGAPVYKNLTNTSGDLFPPFNQPSTLSFTEAYIDPRAERILLTGQPVAAVSGALVSMAIDSTVYDPSAFELVTEVDDDLELVRAGTELLVISEIDQSEEEFNIDLLRPLDSDLASMFSVADLDGEVMDRYTGNGSVLAVVIDYGSKQKPAFVIGTTGQLILVGLQAKQISPLIHVSSTGHMAFGFGPVGGPYIFVSSDSARNLVKFKIPSAYGFPLHH